MTRCCASEKETPQKGCSCWACTYERQGQLDPGLRELLAASNAEPMMISASRSILYREVMIFLGGHVTLAEMNLGIIKALVQQNDTLFKQNIDLAGWSARVGLSLRKPG